GEMVFASALMFPDFFGGEGGVSTNRSIGDALLGVTFGPARQVYYLIAAWCLISMALMYAWTQTPLGRIANAVRDNPERVEFIGYNTHWVRFMAFAISGFFAGIAGGLGAINTEIVNGEVLHASRSGAYLLFT
ncbi:branched-chain amino acid ABC transporter permease, partial [Klebsiella aerogenes]|uniref:branched-chain amino acid ABC transporter permease n=1 Tax=Klebsiella aerogenes TaxID=548 RepID=UPI0013D6BA24